MSSIGALHNIRLRDWFKKRYKEYSPILRRYLVSHRRTVNSNSVLLVAGGHIGDVIMDAPVWKILMSFYEEQGKDVNIIASNYIWNTLKRILDLERVKHIEQDVGLIGRPYSVEKLIDSLKGLEFDTIVLRAHANNILFSAIATVAANHRYAIAEQEMLGGSFGRVVFHLASRRYTKVIRNGIDTTDVECQKELLRILGVPEQEFSLVPIPKQCELNVEPGKYITIAVDSQNYARRWGREKFTELVKRLQQRYSCAIYLTGNALEEEEVRYYAETFSGNDNVIITIGKYSFEEWVELLRGARFHIGVDSGSIHVAASVGTVCICLAGFWDGHRFLPYQFDDAEPEIKKPICVYRHDVSPDELPCFGCLIKYSKFGYGNNECYERCIADRPCLCLEHITVDDVMNTIEDTYC